MAKQSAAAAVDPRDTQDTRTVFGRVPDDVYEWLKAVAREEAARTGSRPMVGSAVRLVLVHAFRASKTKKAK